MLKVEDFRAYYNEYFKEFHRLAVGEYADLSYGIDTQNGTSSSLESIIAYANYIGETTNLLNAGAGASSWMFRNLFRFVTCADPNEHYLNLIEQICRGDNSLFFVGLDFVNNFRTEEKPSFDHIYYDYGDIERLPYLGQAIDLAIKSLYIDDVSPHRECDKPYRDIVIGLCKAKGLTWFDVPESLDSFGRQGIIIEK